jgi:acetylglutamate kinase
MGKYSNVNAASLLGVIATSLSEISSYRLTNVGNILKGGTTLNSKASSKVNKAISSIDTSYAFNGTIVNLKSKLETLKTACEYINKCQSLENEIASLEQNKYLTNVDPVTKMVTTSINPYVQSTINSKNNLLRSYETKVDNLLS